MNFRNTTLVFFLFLLVFNILTFVVCPCELSFVNIFCQHPALFYFPLIFLYLTIPVILSFYPCSQFHYQPVICRGNTKGKEVVITFDDGPDPKLTPIILEILRKHEIKASFFLMGKHIPGNGTIVQAMDEEGHILGNHSYAHTNFWDFWPPSMIYKDMMKTDSMIQDITGKKPAYFRPPYGVINPMVGKAIRMTSYKAVAWSNWSRDTMTRDPQVLLQRIITSLKGGDIILLHDNQEITATILEQLIHEIQGKGFRIVPLNQLLNQNTDE